MENCRSAYTQQLQSSVVVGGGGGEGGGEEYIYGMWAGGGLPACGQRTRGQVLCLASLSGREVSLMCISSPPHRCYRISPPTLVEDVL